MPRLTLHLTSPHIATRLPSPHLRRLAYQDVHFRVWDDEEWNVAQPDPADFFNVLENTAAGTLRHASFIKILQKLFKYHSYYKLWRW